MLVAVKALGAGRFVIHHQQLARFQQVLTEKWDTEQSSGLLDGVRIERWVANEQGLVWGPDADPLQFLGLANGLGCAGEEYTRRAQVQQGTI